MVRLMCSDERIVIAFALTDRRGRQYNAAVNNGSAVGRGWARGEASNLVRLCAGRKEGGM